jgi:NADP-dependent 3-hydroxy acid dehydrogenase YdfG
MVAMVAAAKARWGRIDILINNAGVLRDKSFAKMEPEDFASSSTSISSARQTAPRRCGTRCASRITAAS